MLPLAVYLGPESPLLVWRISQRRKDFRSSPTGFQQGSGLTEVIEKSSTENYVSNAWCLIRTFFWKYNGGRCFPKEMPVIVLEYNLSEEFQNPVICFKKVCERLTKDTKILSRYPCYLIHIGEYQQAIDILTKSI